MNEEDKNTIIPTDNTPTTAVNMYGDKALHADHIENLNVEINVYNNQTSLHKNEHNAPYVPIVPTRYDDTKRAVIIGEETLVLPEEFTPDCDTASHVLPYITALCEVYSEKAEITITPDTIDTLSPMLRRHFSEQRKAYFSAESLHHSVREVFADGENQFEKLKTDAFDGISDTYYDDRHTTGYNRLIAVLEKITSTTLAKSNLVNITGLIGNLEKKGLCHLLVNDNIIKSWVKIDE